VKYRILTGLLMGIFAAPVLCAANISVLVMESGENRESAEARYPVLWENGLLEIFFDAGHIVTNSPKVQIDGKFEDDFPAEAKKEFDNAREVGMDYFLVALIDYSTSVVVMRLFDIRSTKKVLEQKYKASTFRNSKDEYDKIKAAIRVMAAQL